MPKARLWLFVGLGLLLIVVSLVLSPMLLSPSAVPAPSFTSTPTVITPPTRVVAAMWDVRKLPTVTPPASSEPTLPPAALIMHAAPTATPGSPPTMIPLPTTTPTNTPFPTPTPVVATGHDSVPMVEIPAGNFIMGSDYDDADQRTQSWLREYSRGGEIRNFTNESPKLTVDVPLFSIDQFPVTNARYQACVKAGVCEQIERTSPELPSDYASNSQYDDNSVYGVDWNNAMTYCAWVGKRLPTEAEWEKAARGTDDRVYPWGNVWEESDVTPLLSPIGRHPKGASPYQVQDMLKAGGEWTSDLIQYYPGNSTSSYGAYEHSIDRSSWRVVRGLSSHSDSFHWVTVRFGVNPVAQGDIGFRCARGQTPPPTLESMLVNVEVPGTPQPMEQVDLSNMGYVPAGIFVMGHTEPYTNSQGINERADAIPAHVVDLSAFHIDRYKATYSDYAKFINELGGHALTCSGFNCIAVRHPSDPHSSADHHILLKDGRYQVDPGFENFPVDHVTWYGAEAYCTWQGKRLPTEAEWEKAARGTDGRLYPWGNDWDPQATIDLLHPYAIGSQPLNLSPYGAYDMWGNHTEWVADLYASNYYLYSPLDNPTGPLESEWRVQRALGGRVGGLPDRIAFESDSYFGSFRCAYAPH